MKKINSFFQIGMLCACFLYSHEVDAMESILPIGNPSLVVEKTEEVISKTTSTNSFEIEQTTQEAISFEEDEYVRITQPLEKSNLDSDDEDIETFSAEEIMDSISEDGHIVTFSKEINIMGEAYRGMNVQIVSYTIDENYSVGRLEDHSNYTEYKLKTVGATQTFSQLIDLYEGENHIIIYYAYEPEDIEGSVRFVITRETEEVKEQIKNYMATNPDAILGQMP